MKTCRLALICAGVCAFFVFAEEGGPISVAGRWQSTEAVSAEHNGYFTQQFSSYKLRDNPDLAAAAKADAASCEKGTYIAAMEKALKAEADESARLQGLLKRGIR